MKENKEERVEVTEHADGTIRANGIEIFPEPEAVQTPEWETRFNKLLSERESKMYQYYKSVFQDDFELGYPITNDTKLTDFIREEISQAEERGRREMLELYHKEISAVGYTKFVYSNNPPILHPDAIEVERLENVYLNLKNLIK